MLDNNVALSKARGPARNKRPQRAGSGDKLAAKLEATGEDTQGQSLYAHLPGAPAPAGVQVVETVDSGSCFCCGGQGYTARDGEPAPAVPA